MFEQNNNGCFDLLHMGHTKILQFARAQGDLLILGLNTDDSIRRLKGPERPILNQEERGTILAELESVDYVVFFDEDTPVETIDEIRPDVIIKGGDYDPNDYESMPEAKIVHEYGGGVVIFNRLEGRSTTNIVEKIRSGKG
jgi:rfaE bifunctional protein nucleotidyltransferase chain/domain